METKMRIIGAVAISLALGGASPAYAKWSAKKFVKKVTDTAAQVDPTNPSGAVATGAQAIAKGAEDPLAVARHAGDVLAANGISVSSLDPIGSLHHAIDVFQKESSALNKSITSLGSMKASLPSVHSAPYLQTRLTHIKLPSLGDMKPIHVDFAPMVAGYQKAASAMGHAGGVIEHFIMKDVPRETKKLGSDINRGGRKAGKDIGREFQSCANHHGCWPAKRKDEPLCAEGDESTYICVELALESAQYEQGQLAVQIGNRLTAVTNKLMSQRSYIDQNLKQLNGGN